VDAPRARALVDIDDLVDSVLTHHQVIADHRDVSLRHIRIPPGRSPGTVQGDVTQLERVLDRLVSNAVRGTPDGGLILVSVTVDADAVAVEVADEGPGLDAMRISELFSPMHDTHGSDLADLRRTPVARVVRGRNRASPQTRRTTERRTRVALASDGETSNDTRAAAGVGKRNAGSGSTCITVMPSSLCLASIAL